MTSANWSSVSSGFAIRPFRGTCGSAAIVRHNVAARDLRPFGDFPKARRPFQERWKSLIIGDEATTGTGV
jgi:hypothetical protein